MIPCSVQPRELIFVKGYGILSFAKNMGKNIGKNIRKNVSGKYSKKHLDHTKKFATDALKTASKRAIQKPAEATGDLIGNTTANRISKVPKTLQQNDSETITNEHDQEIPKERYIYLRKKDKKLLMI